MRTWGHASKRRHVGDKPIISSSDDVVGDVVHTLDSTSSSQLSNSSNIEVIEESLLISSMLGKEVLEMYQRREQKLWKELMDISLEVHMWTLKTWVKDGAPIVKLHCTIGDLDFGNGSSKHNI